MNEYLTDTSTITSKYQTVIPAKIRAATRLRMNESLIWRVIQNGDRPMIVVFPRPKNWARYLSGLGKEVWRDVDADTYLKKLKEEWQK